jgi:hypothetical protein
MPSPFPGMDPYLERPGTWTELHGTLIVAMQRHLNRVLPERFVATSDRHVWIGTLEEENGVSLREPDVFVTETKSGRALSSTSSTALLSAPQTIIVRRTERRGRPFLRIDDLEYQRVVTMIELLSPTNKKPGPDREAYKVKRQECLNSDINFVEMDLLRSGERFALERKPSKTDYYILVSPVATSPHAGLWEFSVRDRLPVVPIPLTADVKDVLLKLKVCFDEAYNDARLDKKVNYARPPVPPLRSADAAWVKALLAKRQ